jgi:glutamate-1-semialdehyde 2,1-aminomutase
MFRMMGSGNEAVMGATRIARLATKNKRIVKMGGAYHGWNDQMAYSIRIPGSKWTQANGVPKKFMSLTDEFFPNDLADLERVLKANTKKGGTAAVFIEAIGPESGTRPVDYHFPKGVQDLCRKYGALLVVDEVVTGFRIGMSGAQGYYGIDPDLTIFGKVVTGGYPGAGGIGGKAEYMKYLGAGVGGDTKVKKALVGGTLAAAPISCVAGYYTLCEIEKSGAIEKAGKMADRLVAGLNKIIDKYELPFVAFNQGSVAHLDTTGTMQYFIDWSKPWQIPNVLKQTSMRKKEMEHIGAAYTAEGIITLAGNRIYTSAAYDENMIDDVLTRIDRVFSNVIELK